MNQGNKNNINDEFAGVEPMVCESKISVPYSWWAGETATKFLTALRDDKKLLAVKCGTCGKSYVPPRKTCPTCFTDNTEWIELSGKGTVEAFTVARRQLASIPKKVPVTYALIKLEGSDTAMLHYIEGIDPDKVTVGMAVEVEYSENRNGTIQDIACFRPV